MADVGPAAAADDIEAGQIAAEGDVPLREVSRIS
jgi:hypothetical protein